MLSTDSNDPSYGDETRDVWECQHVPTIEVPGHARYSRTVTRIINSKCF